MTRARTNADQAHTESVESIPHIIPGVLYPAVAGKLLDGSTSHSGNYGTAQSDGYSYYYTDIKGSKPIKDPRIGGHFGSQRCTFRSMQKLEQETATHGEEIFSLDGRENIRVGNFPSGSNYMVNNHWGNFFSSNRAGTFLEITGYFNDINIIIRSYTASSRTLAITVNGVTAHSALDLKSTADSPLNVSRYVSVGMLRNIDITSSSSLSSDTALGINTIKFTMPATDIDFHGIELIAQDTSSTANKSKIQIPSQNVVSYGKKFTVSGTPHYDPFNGFTSGTDISSNIDEATSLGMSNWKVSSTWYRPFNGGRVVKWVDSSGNIKTSVTMMPPNAQNVGSVASNAIDLSSSQTNDDPINFNTSAIDNSLSEVAKTFHYREFGNGAANTGGGSDWADASMLSHTTADNIGYAMDDGLTSLAALGWKGHSTYGLQTAGASEHAQLIFIGTGISWKQRSVTHGGNDEFRWFVDGVEVKVYDGSGTTSEYEIIAQNLPYGTHTVEIRSVGLANTADQSFHEFTFHQPKKPPIPEEAVVLADYCLMADFVNRTTEGLTVSKGIRYLTAMRDVFYDCPGHDNNATGPEFLGGLRVYGTNNTNNSIVVTAFSTHIKQRVREASSGGKWFPVYVDGSGSASAQTAVGGDSGTWPAVYGGGMAYLNSSITLGTHKYDYKGSTTNTTDWYIGGFEIATPIHTSSHYQTFETPYLHELVGGDRNMEQTNLVVTPDGKTWDEVTRDTSYIGKVSLRAGLDSGDIGTAAMIAHDCWRAGAKGVEWMNKDFAIAYDRVICLKDGNYHLYVNASNTSTNGRIDLYVNGSQVMWTATSEAGEGLIRGGSVPYMLSMTLLRGDYVQLEGLNIEGGTGSNSSVGAYGFHLIREK